MAGSLLIVENTAQEVKVPDILAAHWLPGPVVTAASSLQGQAGPPAEQQKRVHAAVFEAASRGVRATARAGSPRPGRSLDARTGCVGSQAPSGLGARGAAAACSFACSPALWCHWAMRPFSVSSTSAPGAQPLGLPSGPRAGGRAVHRAQHSHRTQGGRFAFNLLFIYGLIISYFI